MDHHLSAFLGLLRTTWIEYQRDCANYFAVAINYYVLLALLPMLLLFLSAVGLLLRFAAAAVEIEHRALVKIEMQLGPQVSEQITRLLETVQRQSVVAMFVSIVALVTAASVVFRHLRMSFRAIWKYEPPVIAGPFRTRALAIVRERVIAFLMVLGGGGLLLVGAVLIASMHWLKRVLSNVSLVQHAGGLLAALAALVLAAVACGALLKTLPPLPLRWRDIWLATLLCAVGWVALSELLPAARCARLSRNNRRKGRISSVITPKKMTRLSLSALIVALLLAACSRGPTPTYDLVIANGRVIDPESNLDAVRNVGIRGGHVEAISPSTLAGTRVIDATGLVVSPGFIDLHEHGQQEESYSLMVRDGVTSALELEVGTGDVASWYAQRDSGQLVNYGVSVGHIKARMKVLKDPSTALLPAGIGGSGSATDAQITEMETVLRQGLAAGAVAVGFGSAYTPGATMAEIERMFRVAAEAGASAHIHMRNGVAGLDSTIAAANAAKAKLHIVHVNSSGDTNLVAFLTHIQAARDRGQDVTTEAYPYGAGMTEIQSALFDDWKTWPEARYGLHQLVSTGERLNRKTFEQARKTGGTVIIHGRSEEQTRAAIVSPLSLIASDGFIENRRGHPRTSGSYSKVLGKYVRDEKALSLIDALRKMTLLPAQRLEARVPAMVQKGRVKVGADADLTLFDPQTVSDRSTYEDATIPAAGIPYVIVRGEVVVDSGRVTKARPGRAIRAPFFKR